MTPIDLYKTENNTFSCVLVHRETSELVKEFSEYNDFDELSQDVIYCLDDMYTKATDLNKLEDLCFTLYVDRFRMLTPEQYSKAHTK